jgi:hypothetical protein
MAGQVSIVVTGRAVSSCRHGRMCRRSATAGGGCGRVGLDKPAQQLLAAPGGADLVGGVILGQNSP